MRTAVVLLGSTLIFGPACQNPDMPGPVATVPPSTPEERSAEFVPNEMRRVDPLDRPDINQDNSIASGVTVIRELDGPRVRGTASVGDAAAGARIALSLEAAPGEYAVELTKEVAACANVLSRLSSGDVTMDEIGRFAVPKGAKSVEAGVVVPSAFFDNELDRLGGRAILIRLLEDRSPSACGAISISAGKPRISSRSRR